MWGEAEVAGAVAAVVAGALTTVVALPAGTTLGVDAVPLGSGSSEPMPLAAGLLLVSKRDFRPLPKVSHILLIVHMAITICHGAIVGSATGPLPRRGTRNGGAGAPLPTRLHIK